MKEKTLLKISLSETEQEYITRAEWDCDGIEELVTVLEVIANELAEDYTVLKTFEMVMKNKREEMTSGSKSIVC